MARLHSRGFHLRREGCLRKGASRQPLKCPKDHFCILTAWFDERTLIRKHKVRIPSSDRARKCVEQQGRIPVCRSIGSPPHCPLVFGSRILYLGPYVFFVFRSQATNTQQPCLVHTNCRASRGRRAGHESVSGPSAPADHRSRIPGARRRHGCRRISSCLGTRSGAHAASILSTWGKSSFHIPIRSQARQNLPGNRNA